MADDFEAFVRRLPKADLHMHLEGSIEPELMLELAARNGRQLPWPDVAALRAAYHFENLESFLDLYFAGCKVLVREADFHAMTRSYLDRAQEDGVIRAELFIGPQSFSDHGVPLEAVMEGVLGAIAEARASHGMSIGLLVSVHRHGSEEAALSLLERIMPWRDQVLGVGLGGAEIGNPPGKFARFFAAARERGLRTTAHAGEEGPASYVREAIEALEVERIDHGITCVEDPALVGVVAERGIALTVCPLSNLRLQVTPSLARHPLRALMEAGVHVTINSDDPAYFGGYVTENLLACRDALGLTAGEIARLARNGLEAAFVDEEERRTLLARHDAFLAAHAGLLKPC